MRGQNIILYFIRRKFLSYFTSTICGNQTGTYWFKFMFVCLLSWTFWCFLRSSLELDIFPHWSHGNFFSWWIFSSCLFNKHFRNFQLQSLWGKSFTCEECFSHLKNCFSVPLSETLIFWQVMNWQQRVDDTQRHQTAINIHRKYFREILE